MVDALLRTLIIGGIRADGQWWQNRKAWRERLDMLRRDADLTVDQGTAFLNAIDQTQRWMQKQGGFPPQMFQFPDAVFMNYFRKVWDIAADGQAIPLPILLEMPGVLSLFREYFHVDSCAGGCGMMVWHRDPIAKTVCAITHRATCQRCALLPPGMTTPLS